MECTPHRGPGRTEESEEGTETASHRKEKRNGSVTASHRKEKRMEVVWDDATETFPQGEGEEEGGPEWWTRTTHTPTREIPEG